MLTNNAVSKVKKITLPFTKDEILRDYRYVYMSRQMSLLGRKDVLNGKAKFGIFGDGKELAQVAVAKYFRNGDFRSGYYRDQTWMLAAGLVSIEQLFAQLYADVANDPHSAGRQMNSHFATHSINEQGEWNNLMQQKNTAADISCTAGQMPRSLGLALASKIYRRQHDKLATDAHLFTENGNEICFTSIGDASTSEGHFWEVINAAAVLQVPLAVFVWDDGYGISVPKKYQTTKESISEALSGFEYEADKNGIQIYRCRAWNYTELCETIGKGIEQMRSTHIPALFHITEVTQPQGHSTSGSHERYKNKERLEWEREFDCLQKMQEFMLAQHIITKENLETLHQSLTAEVLQAREQALQNQSQPILAAKAVLEPVLQQAVQAFANDAAVQEAWKYYAAKRSFSFEILIKTAQHFLLALHTYDTPIKEELRHWLKTQKNRGNATYRSKLFTDTPFAALRVPETKAAYTEQSPLLNGYEIINHFFDIAFERDAHLLAFGEDVGFIGDVNQGFANLQKKYGETRIFDTGIRELSIIGQGIGLAMRGFRPIAEIQYLDYFIYGLQPLTDDLASLSYRSNGKQRAPLIVRTRGHRLEGIWHTGSPMAMILNSVRGIHVCVPRNFVQAAGMYSTLLRSDEPAIVVECLNGYRLKERLPDNIGNYTVPLGVPEVLQAGNDVTLITYGSCVNVGIEALEQLQKVGISVELIDVQTLLPFDTGHLLVESLKKTNRVLFLDEDVPGGATAFMMQQVLEIQNGYRYLDAAPRTLTAAENRSPYGSDGGYFTKPSAEDIFEAIYEMMHECEPKRFPQW